MAHVEFPDSPGEVEKLPSLHIPDDHPFGLCHHRRDELVNPLRYVILPEFDELRFFQDTLLINFYQISPAKR
jgi:hypothetical protein